MVVNPAACLASCEPPAVSQSTVCAEPIREMPAWGRMRALFIILLIGVTGCGPTMHGSKLRCEQATGKRCIPACAAYQCAVSADGLQRRVEPLGGAVSIWQIPEGCNCTPQQSSHGQVYGWAASAGRLDGRPPAESDQEGLVNCKKNCAIFKKGTGCDQNCDTVFVVHVRTQTPAAVVQPLGGLWEWTQHFDVLEATGANPAQVDRFRNQLNSDPVQQRCMTDAAARQDLAASLNASDSPCKFLNLTNIEGRVSGQLSCGGQQAAGSGDLTGTIQPGTVVLKSDLTLGSPNGDGRTVRLRMTVTGNRIGECPESVGMPSSK